MWVRFSLFRRLLIKLLTFIMLIKKNQCNSISFSIMWPTTTLSEEVAYPLYISQQSSCIKTAQSLLRGITDKQFFFHEQMNYLVTVSTSLCWDLCQTTYLTKFDKDLSTERSKLSQGNSFAHEKKNCLTVIHHSELKNNAMNFLERGNIQRSELFLSESVIG